MNGVGAIENTEKMPAEVHKAAKKAGGHSGWEIWQVGDGLAYYYQSGTSGTVWDLRYLATFGDWKVSVTSGVILFL